MTVLYFNASDFDFLQRLNGFDKALINCSRILNAASFFGAFVTIENEMSVQINDCKA